MDFYCYRKPHNVRVALLPSHIRFGWYRAHLVCSVSAMCVISLPHVCPGRVMKGTATLQIRTGSGRLRDWWWNRRCNWPSQIDPDSRSGNLHFASVPQLVLIGKLFCSNLYRGLVPGIDPIPISNAWCICVLPMTNWMKGVEHLQESF